MRVMRVCMCVFMGLLSHFDKSQIYIEYRRERKLGDSLHSGNGSQNLFLGWLTRR